MRKYIKLVVGLVLIVVLVGPIVKIPSVTFPELERSRTKRQATELKNRLTEREQFNLVKIYKEKLCKSIYEKINVPDSVKKEVKVDVETDNNEEFGNIKSVTVILYSNKEFGGISEKIIEDINGIFDVDCENIRVLMLDKEDADL